MKIGIIGAGHIGRAVAALGIKAGHEVMISNSRDPKTLFSTVRSIGCSAGTVEEAAAFGEIVVTTIPFEAYRSIPAEPLVGKIVADTMNYYPERDGQIDELDRNTTTTSELVAKHLAGARVVKVFNSIYAEDLEKDAQPTGTSNRRALPIAGDDTAAKQEIISLLDQFGYDTVDAGILSEGRRFQKESPIYCVRLNADELRRAVDSL